MSRFLHKAEMATVSATPAIGGKASAMSRLEVKKKNHAAKAQQRNVRSFQPAPLGPVSARARAIGGIATLQQFRQLGDIHRNPSRLIFGEQRCS
jgi:hypothetical protein